MPEIPIDRPLCSPWIVRVTDHLVALTHGGERFADASEIDHAIRFLGMLEIDSGIADPDVRITDRGRIIFRWSKGSDKLAILICEPLAGANNRSFRCYAKYVRQSSESYEETLGDCYPVQVRHILACIFPILRARWALP